MSAAEDDSELRDLLIHNLENSGVLNKLKAQMRAAVFLAMEEQDLLENKGPLANEPLERCLHSRDGRLVASLIMDFLQEFNLDLSLSVFRPEINREGPDSRVQVSRELGLADERGALLLELVRRRRSDLEHQQEPTPGQLALARTKFDLYDPDHCGSVRNEDLIGVFMDLFPGLNRNMVERFITDELSSSGCLTHTADFQMFVTLYKRLFAQCRAVVFPSSDAAVDRAEDGIQKDRDSSQPLIQDPDEELEDGDSFFDDPLPQAQKTYGRRTEAPQSPAGSRAEDVRSTRSLSDKQMVAGLEPEERRPAERAVSINSGRMTDQDYDDDFNSHRSELTHSDLSIGEEIEEVSIEGLQDSEQCDDTQDVSVSRLSPGPGTDYMEDVS
ncbi:centrosomal protein 43 [Neosynchiropus ocellatus]